VKQRICSCAIDDGSEGWYSHPSHSASMMVACSTVGSGGDGVPMTPVCEDPPGQKIDGKNFVGAASGGSGGNGMSSPFEDCLWGRDITRCVDRHR
jgi:hypothetical protein